MKSPLPSYNAVTASARVVMPRARWKPKYDSWQESLWDYYDRLGEFEAAVSWRANTMSRVRLLAAELSNDGEEPTPLTEGAAAEAMARLAGGTGGQAQIMKELTIHLSVPGIGWVVGEKLPSGREKWCVASADELRTDPKLGKFQIKEGDGQTYWRTLPDESIVIRVWNPHPRFGWQPDSDARHALSAMLELDLINKRIIAEIVSRLSSNGILLYDKGRFSFPRVAGNPVGADSVDPFAELFVSVASAGIKDPMSPEATIPIPIGFDSGDMANVDPKLLMQHIRFSEFLDEKLLLERDSAVKRLATSLDMPPETLLGMGDMNHWGAWQIEESGIKIHISPMAELICHAFTEGYLIPYLQAAEEPLIGPNGGQVVAWYDPSEITTRPDRSANTIAAYDRFEVSGRVLRREIGLNEDGDAPSKDELQDMITKYVGRQPATAPTILEDLGGPDITQSSAQEAETAEDVPEDQEDVNSLPDSSGGQPPATEPQSMSDADLAFLAVRVQAELERRQQPVSAWVDALTPLDSRVTPSRRNGSAPGSVVGG